MYPTNSDPRAGLATAQTLIDERIRDTTAHRTAHTIQHAARTGPSKSPAPADG
jgi:hypothetical protein